MGEGLAHILGAGTGDVVFCDNTTINLYKILGYAWQLDRTRPVIVTEAYNFPTDMYVAEGLARFAGGGAAVRRIDDPRELDAALSARRGRALPEPRRLPLEPALEHGRGQRAGARSRRAHHVGLFARRRRGAGRPRRQRRRLRGGLRLQVPLRRPGRARVALRASAAPGPRVARDRRVDGPRRRLRVRADLRAAAGRAPAPDRHARHHRQRSDEPPRSTSGAT